MRDYGKVYTAFWSSQDVKSMSDDGKILALYLMTCPHGNLLGCFRLPVAYVADDLGWESARVSKGFAELFRYGFSYHCGRSSWMFIRKHLQWNKIENPNVGKAAAKLLDSLPMTEEIKAQVVRALGNSEYFPQEKLAELATLSIRYPNPFETLLKPVAVTVTVPVAETEQEQNTSPAAIAPGIVLERRSEVVEAVECAAPLAVVKQKASAPRVDYGDDVREVFLHWQRVRNHPAAKLDDKRAKAIKARFKDGYTVGELCRAIEGISKSPHHMGQNDARTVYDDIELICRTAANVDKFAKLAGVLAGGMSPGLQAQVDILQTWLEKEDGNS